MSLKRCKQGTHKATGYAGCMEMKKRHKYGLCRQCFAKWESSTTSKQSYYTTNKIKSNKKINKMSTKRKVQAKKYFKQRIQFLNDNPECAVTGKQATQVHHMAGRIGDLLLNTSYWLPVCNDAHRQIEDNPEWAKKQGYSVSRLANDKS